MILKTWDIVFEYTPLSRRPNSWISALIRIFTQSQFTHCGVIIYNWYVPYMVEADNWPIKSEIIHTRLQGKYIKVLRSKIEINEKDFAVKAGSRMSNTWYDYWWVFWQAIYILTWYWYGKKWIDASKSMYCSEYVAWLHDLNYWWMLSPADIIEKTYLFKSIYEWIYNESAE